MIHIRNLKEGLPYFKALSSDVRLSILELLTEHNQLNMQEIAQKLGISSATLTMHVKKLYDCELIEISSPPAKHGTQKICYLPKNKLIVDIGVEHTLNNYEVEIGIGHYTSHGVKPTCGIATKDAVIGEFDDPRYFVDPRRFDAQILWFTSGYIEYQLPNYLKRNQTFEEIQITFEISSEAPGICNDWPSNIYFYINDINIGYWISPGDYGSNKGILTPAWWFDNCNQYGLLKLLSINQFGTFIDGIKLSNIRLQDLHLDNNSPISLKLEIPDDSEYVGGLTIFGKHFGNYSQGIHARFIYNIIDPTAIIP